MGNEVHLKSWEEFESYTQQLEREHKDGVAPLLYRGHSNSRWQLAATLERRSGAYKAMEYYRLLARIKPAIESLTPSRWTLPEHSELKKWCEDYDGLRQTIVGYEYLAHVRHQGFPSPLLDWTRSPYVAAYFAFAKAEGEEVAIYVFAEAPKNIKFRGSSTAGIYRQGPYITTHERHFRQQCSYTVCVQFLEGEWNFVPHQKVFSEGAERHEDQDVLWKFFIPAAERSKVLQHLDRFNLNAFSLFASDEGLLETLAFREMR